MEHIKDLIKDNRSTLSASSINAYATNLCKLHKTIEAKGDCDTYKWLYNVDKITDYLDEKAISTRRNYIVAIIVWLKTAEEKNKKLIELYEEELQEIVKEYNDGLNNQEKSAKQKENWLDFEDVERLRKTYKRIVKKEGILSKEKDKLKYQELNTFQKYLVLCLFTLTPPRRSMDYTNMRIVSEGEYENSNKATSMNYCVMKSKRKMYFVFNSYKTAKKHGEQKIEIPSTLASVIWTWSEINPTNYMIINRKHEPMSANYMTKFIQKIFADKGKKISVNMLRSIYLTHKYGNESKMKEKQEDAYKMGNTINTQQTHYVKHDEE